MTTPTERIDLVAHKILRADAHLDALNGHLNAYSASAPVEFETGRHESGELCLHITELAPTPLAVPVILGDIFHNLRSALDHLVYQLVWVATEKEPKPPIKTQFPMGSSEDAYKKQRDGCCQGMTAEMLRALDELRPYKDGNERLWQLVSLNNADKHRALVAVGLQPYIIKCSVAPPHDRFDVKTQNMPVLRVGSLFRVNGLDMTTVEEIVGGVSFAEPGILHGETLDRACLAIRNATVDAINRLTPLLG